MSEYFAHFVHIFTSLSLRRMQASFWCSLHEKYINSYMISECGDIKLKTILHYSLVMHFPGLMTFKDFFSVGIAYVFSTIVWYWKVIEAATLFNLFSSCCQPGIFLVAKCRFACFVRWSDLINLLPQRGQPNFFSPVCVRLCLASSSDRANDLWQFAQSQWNGFSPAKKSYLFNDRTLQTCSIDLLERHKANRLYQNTTTHVKILWEKPWTFSSVLRVQEGVEREYNFIHGSFAEDLWKLVLY